MIDIFVVTNGNILDDLGDNMSGTFIRIHYLLNELGALSDFNIKSIKYKQLQQNSIIHIIYNNIIKSIVTLKSSLILIRDRPIVFFAYPHSLFTVQNRFLFELASLLNLKILLDIHDTIEQVNVLANSNSKLSDQIEKKCISKSSLLLVLNKQMWKSIKSLYNLEEDKKVVFIPNAFDNSFINLYTEVYEPTEYQFNVCYMGGLTKNRGIDLLVQSCREIYEIYPHLKLFLFGSYGEGISDELKEVIDNSSFIVKKEVSRKDIPLSLNQMDLLVMPYNPNVKYLNESSPIKFYEYIGCCKPIICTKCESLTEVGREDSILYVDYDTNDFKKKIELLIQNPQLRENMSQKLVNIRLEHTWKKRAHNLGQAIILLDSDDN